MTWSPKRTEKGKGMRPRKNHRMIPLALAVLLTLSCTLHDPDQPGNLVRRTVTDDPSLPSYTLSDGTKLHLETSGEVDKPVLIVLHGGPGSDYRVYKEYMDELSDSYRMIYWDQRGAGLSERVPDGELTLNQYLADLHELGNYFSPGTPFHLLGHSFGGSYAVYYVQNYPDRVEKLVLLEPGVLNKRAAKNTTAASYSFFDVDLQEFLNSSDFLNVYDDESADYFKIAMAFEDVTDGWVQWRPGFRCNREINTEQGLLDRSYSFDFTTGLEDFTREVLLVAGTESDRLGAEFQKKYHAEYFRLWGGSVWELEGADHYQIAMDPAVVAVIREYLAD